MSETDHGRFWRGYDTVLARTVSVHALLTDDPRAAHLLAAAQASARLTDTHLLRVLDVDSRSGMTFVVNEWGSGTSLDHLLAVRGPLPARAAAWLTCEVAAALTVAHEAGVAHGRLTPENVLIDRAGSVRIIGFAVEAALHGLPPGRIDVDLVDLAALLEAALTGQWAGISESSVPRVPHDQGGLLDRDRDHVLTPRQLQPGVPGLLDDLCHEILNRPHGKHAGPGTAREVHQILAPYVGDPADLHDVAVELSSVGHTAASGAGTPTPAVRTSPAAPDLEPTGPLGLSDLPTQKGTPIFGDDGEVAWFDPRASLPVSPPPPLASPAARPLFAPASHTRRPRRSSRSAPADSTRVETSGAGLGAASAENWLFSTPSGVEEDAPESGRLLTWAIGLGVLTLVLTAAVFVYGVTHDGEEPTATPSTTPTAVAPSVIKGVTALDFDPDGTPPEENRDLAPLVVDGDPTTAWRSSTYYQQMGPGGLKDGVGLILNLHGRYTVSSLDLTFATAGTTVDVFVTETAPTSVAGLERVASLDASTSDTVRLVTPTRGRFVTLWFSALPKIRGGFRVQVAEASVTGTAVRS